MSEGGPSDSVRRFFRNLFRGQTQPPDRYLGGVGLSAYGLLLIALGLALFSALIDLWPALDEGATPAHEVALLWGLVDVSVTESTALILVAALAGALGGFVHAATSFGSYAGNRNFRVSWVWWYWLRLPIGAALALGFYFVLRGGLIAVDGTTEVNPYGVAAFAFIVGLFSKQAIDKLEELFDTLFKVENAGDERRGDKLDERPPVIRRVDPKSLKVGEPRNLTIHGQAFGDDASVLIDGEPRQARWIDETELKVDIREADVRDEGNLRVAVISPGDGGESSNVVKLAVRRA